tara:strand:- start:245 stop:781 length:537 start_codon:yes stop_codon:yes gene_type:complete
MPTKRPREVVEPENLPANLEAEVACPAIYTAQGLYDKRPGDYAKCVQMLAQGTPITRIKKDLKISHNTIAVVRSREQEVIDASKKVMRGLIGVASQMAVEQMIEKLENDQIPAGVLPIATGILIDKHRQYEGEPTQTIEVKKTLSLEEIKAELATLKDEEVIDAEVSDIDPPVPHSPE